MDRCAPRSRRRHCQGPRVPAPRARGALIHRDIKPDNLLVSADVVAKLADFGLSKHFDTPVARSRDLDDLTMTPLGTMVYCAPEVARRERYNESIASVRARGVMDIRRLS